MLDPDVMIHLNLNLLKRVSLLFFLLAVLYSHCALGQAFEGEVIYQNAFKSKIPVLADQQLSAMMGNTQHYFIKGGNYKSESNGTFVVWQLYINADNKIYNKFASSESILWNDAAINKDSVINVEINRDVTEVAGYKCDELVMTCKSGIQKYYFNAGLVVDNKLYAKHAAGNWSVYLAKANALPLKIIIDNDKLTMISIATEVIPSKLDASKFTLPAGIKVEKSPF